MTVADALWLMSVLVLACTVAFVASRQEPPPP